MTEYARRSIVDRMKGAAMLDVATFEEVEHDEQATGQAAVTYVIGAKLLGGVATWGELLRTIGFAQSPGVLMIFGIIPILGGIVRVVVLIWLLIAGIIAIRQALDFSTGKAVVTALLGWLAMVMLAFLSGGGRWFRM